MWLSIRIQLPKDDPLRNYLLRFIFFRNEYFILFVHTIFLNIKSMPFFFSEFYAEIYCAELKTLPVVRIGSNFHGIDDQIIFQNCLNQEFGSRDRGL